VQWVWLPNTIVTGAINETPPIELIRQSQNLAALRLFIDLYASHSLVTHGGIDRNLLWTDSKKVIVGECGPYVIFGFDLSDSYSHASPNAPFIAPFLVNKKQKEGWQAFWEALRLLRVMGLVETVYHLFDSDKPEAEMMHPYAVSRGEAIEQELARTGNLAAQRMLNERYRLWLVPVFANRSNVSLIGIARLRYRPHTKLTGAWLLLTGHWTKFIEKYRDLAGEHDVTIEEYTTKSA
jgi:hypothetical protein